MLYITVENHVQESPSCCLPINKQRTRIMNEPVTPVIASSFLLPKNKRPRSVPRWQFVAVAVLMISLVGCETPSTGPGKSAPLVAIETDPGLESANVMYNTRNFSGAVRAFDTIITDTDASANSHRLAHLGKALIYLGSDKNWYSLEDAKSSLNAAGQIVPESNEGFAIETDMFMDSISAQIDTETTLQGMRRKSGGSGAEIEQLKKERDALAVERDELLEEQKALNEAIEKLKNLTLGS